MKITEKIATPKVNLQIGQAVKRYRISRINKRMNLIYVIAFGLGNGLLE